MSAVPYYYNYAHHRLEPLPQWHLVGAAMNCAPSPGGRERRCRVVKAFSDMLSHPFTCYATSTAMTVGAFLSNKTVFQLGIIPAFIGTTLRVGGLGARLSLSTSIKHMGAAMLLEVIPGITFMCVGDNSRVHLAGGILLYSAASKVLSACFCRKPEENAPPADEKV